MHDLLRHRARKVREQYRLLKAVYAGARNARNNETVSRIIEALRRASRSSLTPAERQWVDRIEDHRRFMEQSDRVIRFVDYGAGKPASCRSERQMMDGVLSTTTVGGVTKASKEPDLAQILFLMVRHLKPRSLLEMGTCVGISASYLGAALSLNDAGSLVTIEGAPDIADQARQTFETLSLSDRVDQVVGPFHETLTGVLTKHSPLDFVFVDGHHDRKATIDYFDMMKPFLARNSVVVFDDIRWSIGMKAAWGEIKKDPSVNATIDLTTIGVACVSQH